MEFINQLIDYPINCAIFITWSLNSVKGSASLKHNNCCLLCLLVVTLKVIVANSVDPDHEQSDLGPY